MLTKEQIKVVRSALVNNDDLYGESRCTALELAAAYERVAALLEHEYEYSATIPWDAVRCALYGDAPDKAGG